MNASPSAARFIRRFGRAPEVHARAPGRVNLIGEHTDYNDGLVLPVATPQETEVLLAPRGDSLVRAWSAAVDGRRSEATYTVGAEVRTGEWIDYIAGVSASLREMGHPVGGCDAAIVSSVPIGAGLASSAAIGVAMLRGLNDLCHLGLDGLDIARIAHRSETHFVGVPVGMMDQMAASLGACGAALFIDIRSLRFERLVLPRECTVVVIDSGIAHANAASGYRTRRAECEEAARLLGVGSLRDVAPDQVGSAGLPGALCRRVRHVVTENDRVSRAVQALREDDAAALGMLMNASHQSLRDDFEVSLPPIDRLVELAQSEPGIYGARMTGGGFGGAVVALARAPQAEQAARRIAAEYTAGSAHTATVVLPLPAQSGTGTPS
jgi:galactokinase